MIHYLKEAAKNFTIHQIREEFTLTQKDESLRTVIAYIDTDHGDNKTVRVYVCVENSLLKKITELLLMEEVDDKETLCEMALETSNLIIGSAKVLAEEAGTHFSISTPHQSNESIDDFDEHFSIEVGDSFMSVYTKEQ